MNINRLLEFLLIFIYYIFYSSAHSASSSSALATGSIRFKNPKLDKEKSITGRKNKIGIGDDGSKCNIIVFF
jgi:hypothetical protein